MRRRGIASSPDSPPGGAATPHAADAIEGAAPDGSGAAAPARLVAVGASNLARLALPLLDAHRAATGGPVEMHAALGRGRSFGTDSSLLFVRGLGSVLDSGLWRALAGGDRAATTALLLDVGNDLLYGAEVPRILAWVETALQRLAANAARLVVVGLPLASIATLGRWRYLTVRTLVVPGCRLSLAGAVAGSEALHAGLRALAARHRAEFHDPPRGWYGVDPIHVRRRHWRTAARTWLGAPAHAPEPVLDTPWRRLAMLGWAPAERRWLGVRTTRAQPVRRWPDGSSLALW